MPDRLAQHLVERGLVSAEQLDEAKRRQAAEGGTLDTNLLELGVISEAGMLQALADVSDARPVHLADFEPNADIVAYMPRMIAERLTLTPLSVDGDTLHVACSYPVPDQSLREVGLLLGKPLVLWVGIECRIREWISVLYKVELPPRYAALLASLSPQGAAPSAPAPGDEVIYEPAAGDEEPILLERKKGEPWAVKSPAPLATPPPPRGELKIPAALRGEPTGVPEVPPVPLDQPPIELRRAPDPTRHQPPNWTLAQARAALQEARFDRDKILDVALRFGLQTFEYVAAFAVVRGAALGWDARGEGAQTQQHTKVSIPLDAGSVFRTVAVTRGSYLGPVPTDHLSRRYLESLGRTPRTMVIFPLEVFAMLYGDNGAKPTSQRRLSEFLLFCQDLPSTFHDLIAHRKQQGLGTSFERQEKKGIEPLAPIQGGLVPRAELGTSGWGQSAQSSYSPIVGRGRSAGSPALPASEEERPPPDFTPLLRRLTGPDAAQRAHAMADLQRTPEASSRVLAQHFPGPTAWTRLPVTELPEADELGPIPAALSRLGRPGAQALAPLLDANDAETRYFALLTAGNLLYPELVDGVLRGLFDLEPDISSAARVAATTLRRLPRFDAAMRQLRQELTATDTLRRSLAARALGVLHDRQSIDGLIGLTASEDQLCAQAAGEALKEITKATFGTHARSWTMWWAENRSRKRVEWLVAGLHHKELDIRLACIEELSAATNDNLGYFADAPPTDRAAAIKRWEALLSRGGTPRLNAL